jgi:peptidoglycan hydrolase-like protein with peptidoglycan-binding domain
MMKLLTAFPLCVGLVLSLPLNAAQKKAAPSKSKAQAQAKTQTKAKAKPKKPAPAHYAQQHPTAERYTEIQAALVDRGLLPATTGVWGTDSVEALKKFQQDQGLRPDGKLGALSLRALGLGPRREGTVEDAITAGVLPSGSAPTPLD